MIIYTTCVQCGLLLEPATLRQRVHPGCPPAPEDQLERAYLAAVLAGDHVEADALARQLDRLDDGAQTLLEAATAYARQGWPVFPCRALDKRPATAHGFHDATTDTARVERWWQRHPDHNIGIATGHVFDVVDFDLDKPGVIWKEVDIRESSDLEVHGLVTTPRGIHAYVLPTGQRNASRGFGLVGIDYRGIGGYVVVPPSVRDDGKYSWWVEPSPRIKNNA